jgi:phospholipase C
MRWPPVISIPRKQRVLRSGVLVVGVASAVVAGSVSHSAPARASVSSGNPIKHVVIIYQENHSFDEVLGALCVQDARCDGSLSAKLLNGTTHPLTKSADIVPTINHDTLSESTAINGGAMNGWEKVKGCNASSGYQCLTYYDPTQIPNLASLARSYALSDRTFQLDKVPSFGAHIELVAATLDGFTGVAPAAKTGFVAKTGWGCDSNKFAPWKDPANPNAATITVPACIPDYTDPLPFLTTDRSAANGGAITSTPVAQVPTLLDSLDAAGLSWHLYTSSAASKVRAYTWSICPVFAKCLYTSDSQNMVPPNQILSDATAGTLPAFSILLPEGATGSTSQHNGDSMLVGDNWIGQTVSSIMNGPDWASTAVFITYDDCGCFYDHVTPPAGLGIRNPVVIVSPYARPGFTDSSVATTASLLAFTEHTFGLSPIGLPDAVAYDYADSFDFGQAPSAGVRLVQRAVPPASVRYLATHTANPDDPT